MKVVKKLWGSEEWLVNEPEYCCKILRLKAGFQSSLHYHPVKKETFIVAKGIVRLEQFDERPIDEILLQGDSRTIMPKTPHRFSSGTESKILEVSTHHSDEDVVRLEPSGALP